jgi:hypothetical protein
MMKEKKVDSRATLNLVTSIQAAIDSVGQGVGHVGSVLNSRADSGADPDTVRRDESVLLMSALNRSTSK